MPKKIQSNSQANVKPQASLGSRIFEALTETEIFQLLDELFAVLSDEQRSRSDSSGVSLVFSKLKLDTKATLTQILTPPQTIESEQTAKAQPTSLAKLSQTWSQLWREWNEIIWEASQEEGKYIVQERHWEEPYFDNYTLVEDLEAIAKQMKPLVKTAFDNNFSYDDGFALNLLSAESDISDGIPDWMEIRDGIHLEGTITHCLLEWEWLLAQEQGQDGFKFAQNIRKWEEKFVHISLDGDAIIDFCSDLPDVQKQLTFAGMTGERENSLWKYHLENTHSHWHMFYMETMCQFATPEIYLHNLRSTIAQEWENGLPVIEDLLAKQEYRESVVVIQETLDSLLQQKPDKQAWTPETSLLFLLMGGYSRGNANQENAKKLLRYYQQAVRELGETEQVNALEIQCIAFECCYDWSRMLAAFAETPVTEKTRQTLLKFWCDSIIKRGRPHSYSTFYTREQPVEIWWLHWLLDTITSEKTGQAWFGEQAIAWLENLPGDRGQLGGEYGVLHLLTKDLTDIKFQGKCPYPKFYEVVVVPNQSSTPDDVSRKKYLQEYAPLDLWERVMDYWRANLHNFVPKPEMFQNSDYSTNAAWMSALKELSPQNYQMLLSQWKIQHQRRRNLWKAMGNLGLM
jgi:hypothetical protein